MSTRTTASSVTSTRCPSRDEEFGPAALLAVWIRLTTGLQSFGRRRSGLTEVELVFKLPQSFVVDLAFVAQAHGGLPFYPEQISGQAREVLLMRRANADFCLVLSCHCGKTLPIMPSPVL